MKAIDASLPHELESEPVPNDLTKQRELHITEMECEKFSNLADWFAGPVGQKYQEGKLGSPPAEATGEQPADPNAPAPDPNDPNAIAQAKPVAGGPTGEGWVIQLTGYHFHNTQRESQGAKYVRDTLIKRLEEGKVQLPKKGEPGVMESVDIKDLGITHPVLMISPRIDDVEIVDPFAEPAEAPAVAPVPGMAAGAAPPAKTIKVPRFDFVVQFAWKETPISKRLENLQKAASPGTGESPTGEPVAGN
jgi:type IV pilus assembly protein PilM